MKPRTRKANVYCTECGMINEDPGVELDGWECGACGERSLVRIPVPDLTPSKTMAIGAVFVTSFFAASVGLSAGGWPGAIVGAVLGAFAGAAFGIVMERR